MTQEIERTLEKVEVLRLSDFWLRGVGESLLGHI